jgi:hypothetical protein
MKTIRYQLIREEAIRDKNGDAMDWECTIVAESGTVNGLVTYAKLKKLDKNIHGIEEVIIEDGIRVEENRLGGLDDLSWTIKKALYNKAI